MRALSPEDLRALRFAASEDRSGDPSLAAGLLACERRGLVRIGPFHVDEHTPDGGVTSDLVITDLGRLALRVACHDEGYERRGSGGGR